MPVTKDQARLVAALAAAIRAETYRAGQWDEPGIIAAIQPHAAMTLAEVARAVTRAAEDATAKTPAVLRDTRNPCWRERSEQRPSQREVPVGERCGVCGKAETHRYHDDDHPFEAHRRHAAPDPKAHVDALRSAITTGEPA